MINLKLYWERGLESKSQLPSCAVTSWLEFHAPHCLLSSWPRQLCTFGCSALGRNLAYLESFLAMRKCLSFSISIASFPEKEPPKVKEKNDKIMKIMLMRCLDKILISENNFLKENAEILLFCHLVFSPGTWRWNSRKTEYRHSHFPKGFLYIAKTMSFYTLLKVTLHYVIAVKGLKFKEKSSPKKFLSHAIKSEYQWRGF